MPSRAPRGIDRFRSRMRTALDGEGPIGAVADLLYASIGAYFSIGTAFTPQSAGAHVDPQGLGGYYCDFRHKASPSEEAPGSWLEDALAGRPWMSPMMVSQTALGYWERRFDGEDTTERFLALADWLVRYGTREGEAIVWHHDHPVGKYGLAAGWQSGMTQGEAISVLLRAHSITDRDAYLDVASRAFEPFAVPVPEGGVVRVLDGALVVEEYPTSEPTAVLNGWIFGLLGLHELAVATGDPRVAEVLDRTRDGLVRLLPRYDVGWWSRYSLGDPGRPDLAKPFYQRLHCVLLRAVDLARPEPSLREMADRWEAQITRPAMARIAVDKLAFRIYRELRPAPR